MLVAKGMLRRRVVYDGESVVVDLNAVRVCPHLEKLILSLHYHHLPIRVVLEHSNLQLVLCYILHC